MNLIQISIIFGAFISFALSYQIEKTQNDINPGILAYFDTLAKLEAFKNVPSNEKYTILTNHVETPNSPELATEPEEDNVCIEEAPQKPAIEIQDFRNAMLRELKKKAAQYLKNVHRNK